ncbi:MAG: urea ABC transporter permease subunit UrtC [Oscillospiraceae bacterium]|jgi:urea transport system permease protein|nr:urea ABC transporter permease subunit UrtC [Oscillospiraceae bacterium]
MTKLKNQAGNLCFSLIIIGLAVMPLLMAAGVAESPLIIFLGKCVAFSIVAIGLDLIWGYTGILSLGHGLYFALGGYGMAMYLKLRATHGAITEFMHTGGLTALPAVWKPFQSLPLTVLSVLIVPAGLAYIIGYFIFKNRIKGVYFSIISQALTWAAYSVFIALSPYTNGNVGITEIGSLAGKIRGSANQGRLTLLFYVSLAILALIYATAAFLVRTKFGKLLIAIRDGENRTYFSGYRVSRYKTFIYVLSAAIAAVAGAIFVNFNGSITPSQMTIAFSVNMVIWVAIGGRGTIVGAVIGALLVNLCEYNLSSGGMIEVWQYIVGGIFCVTILFFKGGIMGLFREQIPAFLRKLKVRGGQKVES